MKVLIVDDEALARARLRTLMEEIGPPYEVVGEAGAGEEALRKCAALGVDLVLMDISMPGMDGLTAAARLADTETPPAVIFTTAYGDHALEAFEDGAVDYLLKPIRVERLRKALEKARSLNRAQIQMLEEQEKKESGNYVCANVRGGIQRIPIDEIIYFLADQKYVCARHKDGEVLLEESLRSLEERFGQRFLRIHRNALVSRNCLIGLEKGRDGQNNVRLRGASERLQVSRRHLPRVRQWLKGK
ncbi:MAG TPA: response regulator transcription factor [Sedimenticola sp.]|nr:response regulator transcription factor [Sedimenticola sp.]